MKHKIFKLFFCKVILLINFYHLMAQHPNEFMMEGKWGVMHHFLADFYGAEDPTKWNELIDDFDVEGLANQLAELKVGWVIFTIGQNSGYYCAPNSVYDSATNYPISHCSKRDLISDLADALNKKNIPLIAYIPFGFLDSHEPKNYWYPDMVREYSLRWGTKIKGWWFDGYYGTVEKLPEMTNAAKAGNPNAVLAFNPGLEILDRTCEFETYTAGEYNNVLNLQCEGRWKNGAQWHCVTKNTFLWGGRPTEENQKVPLFSDKEIVDITSRIINSQGAITWNVDLEKNGKINHSFIRILESIRNSIDNGTNSSTLETILHGETLKGLTINIDQYIIQGEKTRVEVIGTKETGEYLNLTGLVKYNVNNSQIAEIDNKGLFTSKTSGKVEITAFAGERSARVIINIVPVKLDHLQIYSTLNKVGVHQKIKIFAFGIRSDGSLDSLNDVKIKYTVNKPKLASINNSGELRTKKGGRITISAVIRYNGSEMTSKLPMVIQDLKEQPKFINNCFVPPFKSIPAQTSIILDGENTEETWTHAFEYPLCYNQRTYRNFTPPNDTTIKASFMLCYKGDTLFGLIKRYDNLTYTQNCIPSINDGIEVYIGIDEIFAQLMSTVGRNFNQSFNKGYANIVWNAEGTVGEFGIQLPNMYLPDQIIDFNIDIVDNDNQYKVFQLFPLNGNGKSFLGKDLGRLKFLPN